MKTVIAITGVPGTGKTTLSKFLAEELNARIISDKGIIEKYPEIVIDWDEVRNTRIVDEQLLIEKILEEIEKTDREYVIVDSHLSHLLPPERVKLLIYLKADPNEIAKRLEDRGYNLFKIFENVWAENLGIIEDEIKDIGHKNVLIFDTTNLDLKKIWRKVRKILDK